MRLTKKDYSRYLVAGASSLAMMAGAASAQAQDDDLVFEEIVVTAQKRTESVEDVPLAISAFDANFTKRTNLDDVKVLR